MDTAAPIYVTPQQLADHFGVSLRAVTDLMNEGRIPFYEFGPRLRRINLRDAEEALAVGR